MSVRLLVRCLFFGLFAGQIVTAQPPSIIEEQTPGTLCYQGRVISPDGTYYPDGVCAIEFRVYENQTTTNFLWGASYLPYVQNGYFSVLLGSEEMGASVNKRGTYKTISEFWKAMWMDPKHSSRKRYIGMTILEKGGVWLPDVTESFPRQELKTLPFISPENNSYAGDSTAKRIRSTSAGASFGGNVDVLGTVYTGALNSHHHLNITSSGDATLQSGQDVRLSGQSFLLKASNQLRGHGRSINLLTKTSGNQILANDEGVHVASDKEIKLAAGQLTLSGDRSIQFYTTDLEFKRGGETNYLPRTSSNNVRIEFATIDAAGALGEHSSGILSCRKRTRKNGQELDGSYIIRYKPFGAPPVVTATGIGRNSLDNWYSVSKVDAQEVLVCSSDDDPSREDLLWDSPFNVIIIGKDR